MKSKTKGIIASISFLIMITTLPIMDVLNNYYLMVADLIVFFISALFFLFFCIYWMFPNKRERAISRAKARKDLDTYGNHLPWEEDPVFHAL